MHTEIQIATQFLSSYVPTNEQQRFSEDLQSILLQKYQKHWYPEEPERGTAFRAIKIHSRLDSVLTLLRNYTLASMPSELVLWVDPGCVSYRIGSNYIVTLYDQDTQSIPQDLYRQAERRKVRMSPPLSPPQSDVTYRVEAITA
jgi:protein Tob/BTG